MIHEPGDRFDIRTVLLRISRSAECFFVTLLRNMDTKFKVIIII